MDTSQATAETDRGGSVAVSHHTAIANGVRLHYATAGAGDPVVLLHGWPQTWRAWRRVIPALAAQYTVIAPDLRGLGDSEKPSGGYDRRTVAEDVRQLVHGLGLGPIHLVGHDLGGPVAYTYAAEHPREVRRLAILEVPDITGVGIARVAREHGLWHIPFHAVPDIPETLVAGHERSYFSWFYRGKLTYDPSAIAEEDIDEYVRCYSAPGGLRAGFAHYRALYDERPDPEAPLAMPVLALGGERSLGPLVAQALRRVASDVRGGVVDRCGHWIPEERPDDLAGRLLAFFAEGA